MSSDRTEAEAPLGRVTVLGLGVMGGSLCRALRDTGIAERVTGWSPEPTERDAAKTARAVDFAAAEWRGAVRDADLVVLATPLDATLELISEVGAHTRKASITDLASLKAPVSEAVRAAGLSDRWIGAHPMCGSEQSGFWASRADLYQGARVWLCRADGDPTGGREGDPAAESVARVSALWRGIGGDPGWIDPGAHDELMAIASHLPQLVANALAETMERAGVRRAQLGPGGRDMTRLASSNPAMWRDLLGRSAPVLTEALRGVGASTDRIARLLEAGDVDSLVDLMKRTGRWSRG